MSTELIKEIDDELQSEIETLRAMYDNNEVTINRKDNLMVIEYMTNKIKIIFAFNINKIESTIIISVKNRIKNKNSLNEKSINLITSFLMNKFKEEIENMPIYQSIDYFNNELKENQSLFTSSTKPKKEEKEEKEEKKGKKGNKDDIMDKEYIAFIRFNHLFHGKQHKKENQMLTELKNLKNCSHHFFGYYLYGKPGIICICSTTEIIKIFAKKCNEIGKKSVISNIIDIKKQKLKIDKNTIKTIDSDNNEKLNNKELKQLLINLQLNQLNNDIDNTLSIILTGNGMDFIQENKNKNMSISKDVYWNESKYEFEIEIKTSNGPYATTNGNLYISIFGENENKLINQYQFEVKDDNKKHKKTTNIKFNFEFNDIEFLNKIGILNKIYFENDSKDSWQCEWIKINVYQISLKKLKKKRNNKKQNKPKLVKQYQAKMRKWINKNNPRYAYLSISS